MRPSLVAALGAAMMLSACASITRGTDEAVVFDSDPPGAEMRSQVINVCGEEKTCAAVADNPNAAMSDYSNQPGPSCVTPCTIQVKRNVDLIATFTKPGYEAATLKVGRAVSGSGGLGVAGNVIAGGVTGLVVDSITGAGMDHFPNPAKVTLVPIKRPDAPAQKPRPKQASNG